MRHLSAFYQSINLAGLTAINAVPDTQNVTNGLNVQVPAGMANVGFVQALYNGTAFTQAQLQSPTLRNLAPYDVSPITLGATQLPNALGDDIYMTPIALTATEYLNMAFNGTAAGAVNAYGLVEFVDGPPKPATGKIFTVRGTGAAALVDGNFVNTPVTLDAILPAGTYNQVGFRAEGPNLIAARVAFLGQGNRPGCPGNPDGTYLEDEIFRKGGLGVWGTFTNQTFPSVDCLGNTDAAQVFYFDLIKTA